MEKVLEVKTSTKIRSTAYPSIDLGEAVQIAGHLRKGLGNGPYNREAIAKAIGYKSVSGASSAKIAALVHFGILARDGNTYRQSPLADRILYPVTQADQKLALREAVQSPKLFKQLIDEFKGKSLPTLLSNILFHNYGISEKVAKDVELIFIKSLEYIDLLQNGVVINFTSEQNESIIQESLQDETENDSHDSGKNINFLKNTNKDMFPVVLDSGVIILFPKEFTYPLALGKFAQKIEELNVIAKSLVQKEDKSNTSKE